MFAGSESDEHLRNGSPSPAVPIDNNESVATSNSYLHLSASIDCIGVSLLGSTPSSTCLKLEWRGIFLDYHANNTKSGENDANVLAKFEHIKLYSLQRKELEAFEFTPFAAALHHGSEGFIAGSPDSEWTLPFQQQQQRQLRTGMARRSLSGRLGLASATHVTPNQASSEGMYTPMAGSSVMTGGGSGSGPYVLPKYTGAAASTVSRYYSAADSEFEDAMSEMLEGMFSVHLNYDVAIIVLFVQPKVYLILHMLCDCRCSISWR